MSLSYIMFFYSKRKLNCGYFYLFTILWKVKIYDNQGKSLYFYQWMNKKILVFVRCVALKYCC